MYVPNGIRMNRWKPTTTGANYALPPILSPLATVKQDINVISGLANYPASVTQKEFAGSHARGTGSLLTQTPLTFGTSNLQNGKSLDQIIADQMSGKTALPSLELGFREGSASGNCEDGYSCSYLHNLSWRDGNTPMKKIAKPDQAFQRLFTTTGGSIPAELNQDRSILDSVQERIGTLNKQLGRDDKAKMDQYLTSVREVEKNLPAGGGASSGSCPISTAPVATQDYEQTTKQFLDLMALAFQCDKTRVITYMMEDSLDTPARYSFLGVSDNFHELSHHGGSTAKLDKIETINTWEVKQFYYLVNKLKSINEGDRSLLDNCIMLFTSEFGDGDNHYHWDLPMLMAGKGGGYLKTGLHVSYPIFSKDSPAPSLKDRPLADLFLTVLGAYGINQSTFGSTGTSAYGKSLLTEIKA